MVAARQARRSRRRDGCRAAGRVDTRRRNRRRRNDTPRCPPELALLFLGVLSAFGNASHIGFVLGSDAATGIEAKPWHFLSTVYLSTVGNLLLVKYGTPLWRRLASLPTPERNDVVSIDDRS